MSSGLNRSGSSPPSPVLDLPPSRFIAMASVVCASAEIEPKLIAPVAEPLDDLAGGFDLAQRDRSRPVLKRIKPRSVQRSRALSFDVLGETLVRIGAVRAGRHLEVGDRLGVPHVALAVGAPVELAIVRKDRQPELVFVRVSKCVALDQLLRDHVEADALNAAGGSDEAKVDRPRS